MAVPSGRPYPPEVITASPSTHAREDLDRIGGAYAYLHRVGMRDAIRSGDEHVGYIFGVLQQGPSGHYDRVVHCLRGHGDRHGHTRPDAGIRFGRFHPNFDGGAARIERGTDERNARCDRIFVARQFNLRRVARFQSRRLSSRDMRFGNQLRSIHHGEQRLIRCRPARREITAGP